MGRLAKTRLKRILLLAFFIGVSLAGIKFLPEGRAQFWEKLPISQVLNKATGLVENQSSKEENKKAVEEKSGQVAGAAKEILGEPQQVVQNKINQVIEILKNLPEEEAQKVKAEIKKQICEEVLGDF
jgi:membrane-associated HD superfamily phosphohydrolase